MSETQKDITDAIEATDYDKLRDIAERLSLEDDPAAYWLARRVRLAAAIVEVAKIGEDLAANDEDALNMWGHAGGLNAITDAVEACIAATGEVWPSGQLVLEKWLFNKDNDEG
jgi:hypothetical protein